MMLEALLLAAFAAAVEPRPQLSVSEWADENRVLSTKAASEAGRWRTDRIPFLREIQDCLSTHSPVREVVFMKSTQVGGTEIGLNWAGYVISHAPGPMLAVLPTVEVGTRWAKQRLSPMIADAPVLSAKIAPAASRDGSNTTLMKEYPDGILIIGGANSAASLSSMPIKYLLLDEVDRFPLEVEEEGDPVDLAEARQTTFPRRKVFKVSSPTIESLSRINKDWQRSDQREYFVPCPHCGEMQVLELTHLVYPDGAPELAQFACIGCGALIEESCKGWMLERGEWRQAHPGREIAGFHISAWYTPPGLGKTWGQHALRYEEVKHDPARLKVFTNTVEGRCYEDPNEKLDWEELKARGESTKLRDVPVGILLLTAGCDVQKDRIEYQVVGWGRGERSAVIDDGYFPGDPTRPEVWQRLDEYLGSAFRNRYGVDLRLRSVAIDSGYLPDEVLQFTRVRKHRGIFAIKGASVTGKPVIGRPSKVDFKRSGQVFKGGAEQWQVGVDTAKHRLFARLAGDRKIADPEARMVRFSQELPDEWFRQLSAEVFDPHKRRWVKVYERNEALDKMVYAMAAAMHPNVRVHLVRAPQWEQLEAVLEPKVRDLLAAAEQSPAAEASAQEPPADSAEARRSSEAARKHPIAATGGWINGWKT
jgi:phage terminase large subunit GpA-like protein